MAHRRVTIDDIARESGASPTTVSLVLRDKPGIGTETRERVLAVARALGYQQRGSTRAAGATEPRNIALIVRTHAHYGEGGTPNINPFYSWVLAGIESSARSRDMNLLYATLPVDDLNRHRDLPGHLLQQELDGVLLVGAFQPATIAAITATRSGPIVQVDGATALPGLDVIATDNEAGAHAATSHLVSLGHRRVALLSPEEGANTNFDLRRAGYRAALAVHGLAPVEVALDRSDPARSMTWLRAEWPDVTALFAVNDQFALGAIAALEAQGVRVPGDISVVGFDNIELPPGRPQTLTTMSVDKSSLGRLAVETLHYRMAWPDAAEITVALRPRLLRRGTDAALGAASPGVSTPGGVAAAGSPGARGEPPGDPPASAAVEPALNPAAGP